MVQKGLTPEGVQWAFASFDAANWHPLTWLSHMLDIQLYGLNPGAHHQTNIIFHILNTLLLFLVFKRMTAKSIQSALVAALFALHPLHVESVTWVAERKDVLSTFFWMLAMCSYAWYVEHPEFKRYACVVLCLMLGLMAKPMLVTLPFVLLLLDLWPLRRIQFPHLSGAADGPSQRRVSLKLIVEKAPLFALAAISCIVTFLAQRTGGSVAPLEKFSLAERLANASVSYLNYMGKMIWPSGLAVFYPRPDAIPGWQVAGACLFLTAIFLLAVWSLKKRPWVAVGWLWYFGTLIPVIGLVQVGLQAMANRYTYIPLIGLFVIVVWGMADFCRKFRVYKPVTVAVCAAALLVLAGQTRQQVHHWSNSTTLFQHTLQATGENGIAYLCLGDELVKQGKLEAGIGRYQSALKLIPGHPQLQNNLGVALVKHGEADTAAIHFRNAILIKSNYAEAHSNLASIYIRQGQLAAAGRHLVEALRLAPDFADAYNNLGMLLMQQGRVKAAFSYLNKALELDPGSTRAKDNLLEASTKLEQFKRDVADLQQEQDQDPANPQLRIDLGNLYKAHGEYDDAAFQYQEALALHPGWMPALNNLAIIQAARGDYNSAIKLCQDILTQQPDLVEPYYIIASIYSRQGAKDKSIKWLKQAVSKGYRDWDQLRQDANLNNIRNTSYYKKLIKENLG